MNYKNKIVDWQEAAGIIKNGGIVVLPTDTLYGVVASVWQPAAVERLYKIRRRPLDKPCIVLLGEQRQLLAFDIHLTAKQANYLRQWWPGAVSVVLPCAGEKWQYLHRGQDSLAFRCVADDKLRQWLIETGPIIAPTANLSNQSPSLTIAQAMDYFSDQVDGYVDAGRREGHPSTVISLFTDKPQILRPGAIKLNL
ncbi:MAG: L-threonylcarbamoyladenylate synthase [Candidatus Komeilibacteria bacterium]